MRARKRLQEDDLFIGYTHAYDCTVTAQINGAVTPGALAGRAENCTFENCAFTVEIDGSAAEAEIGTTEVMYESLDQ